MSSACVCHTSEWCFYCEMYVPLEKERNRLRNMAEIVLHHCPDVDDPIDYETAYKDLKDQIFAEYDKNPWLGARG